MAAPTGWEPKLPEWLPTPLRPITVETNFLAPFVTATLPTGWQAVYPDQVPSFKPLTVETNFFGRPPFIAAPTGWEPKLPERIPTPLKPLTAEFSFLAPQQVAFLIPLNFYQALYLEKIPSPLKPTTVETNFLVPLPFAPAAVDTIPSGDGPPWGLTDHDAKQLKEYYAELARLHEQYAEEHRANVQELLNDVKRAAGLTVDEVEEETGPVAAIAQPEEIRERIQALPQLPDRSLFSVDLQALKVKAAEDARLALEEDDEETISVLLLV